MSVVLEKENGEGMNRSEIKQQDEEKKEIKINLDAIEKLCEEMKIREVVPNDNNGSEFGLVGVVRHKTGGLQFVDKEQMKTQSGVLKELITTFGANLLKGKRSLVNI